MALQGKLPHNYHSIVENADSKIDISSVDKLFDQLHSGVYLNQKRKRFTVEKDSGANNFELFARDLLFSGQDWKWDDTDDVEVAELVNGQHIEVKGELNTNDLTPNMRYEVIFLIKMKKDAEGWEYPVNLKLQLPKGPMVEKKENLSAMEKEKWIEIPAGKFPTFRLMNGELKISMYELNDQWKKGLVIKEVIIRPA